MKSFKFTRPSRRKFYLWVFVFGAWPLVPVILASWLAETYGCQLTESTVYPCVFWGADHGETLYSMLAFGWALLATVPVAVWVVVIYEGTAFGAFLARKMDEQDN